MFRRRKGADEAPQPTAAQDGGAADAADRPADPAQQPEAPVKPARANGPWDVDELDGSHPSHERARVDLGGLRVRPVPGMQIQMQVDSTTGKATSVLLIGEDAALQLLAVAAARSVPMWPTMIAAVAADATRRGGTAQRAPGPWGQLLQMQMPATTSTGVSGVQPSMVVGIDGPRWMLRATLIGKAAVEQEAHDRLLAVVQDTVVVRGEVPMSPGEVIELRPPARPAGTPADPADDAASELT
jgi:hypothetical protein